MFKRLSVPPLQTVIAFPLLVLFQSCQQGSVEDARRNAELRGVWLTNVDSRVLESRENITEAMEFLARHNFNAVFPVVWNKGFTLYPSPVMDSLFGIRIDTVYGDRDPLGEVIEEAHARDMAVIPWFEFGFSCSHNKGGGLIIRTKPSWAARDREGKLLTKNGFEWMNAFHPEVQEFMLALVLEVVRQYPVDGVQGDDRLPAQPVEGGYDDVTVALYRSEHGGQSPPMDFRDPEWVIWRAGKLSAFARRLYDSVKAANPAVLVSWSPSVYPWSLEEYLQDWPSWVKGSYADLVHPQMYRYSLEEYIRTADSHDSLFSARGNGEGILYPGVLISVGAYLIPDDYLLAALAHNRARKHHGEVFFFYEGLRRNEDRLARLLKERFYGSPARLPFRRASVRSK